MLALDLQGAKAFEMSKKLLMSGEVLIHCDPKLMLMVAGDTSAYETSAVLLHKMPSGEKWPIAFASVTVNQVHVIAEDQYPLPKPDELFATLTKGKIFSKPDLSQAYLQLDLDDASVLYVSITTTKGYTHLSGFLLE